MVLNFLGEGAAINVLARLHHAELSIVDVGVDAEFGDLPGLLQRKIRPGTRNMLHEPAMTEEEMLACRAGWSRTGDRGSRRKGKRWLRSVRWESATRPRRVC